MSLSLEQTVKDLLIEQIQYHSDIICKPGVIRSFEEYSGIIGKIAGLKEALELLDQAVSEVNKSRGN